MLVCLFLVLFVSFILFYFLFFLKYNIIFPRNKIPAKQYEGTSVLPVNQFLGFLLPGPDSRHRVGPGHVQTTGTERK
jgi:hypothetical protein